MKAVQIFLLLIVFAFITILISCSTSSNTVFIAATQKGEKLNVQTNLSQFFKSDSTNYDTCKFSPISYMTIANEVSDTVSLKLHSLSQNKTIEFYNDFLPEGIYYINIEELNLPKATYIMNYKSKTINANQAFCN